MAQGTDDSQLMYNSSEEEDASVLCIGLVDTSNLIIGVLDIRRPRWSPQDSSLPFTEHDEIVATTLGQAASSLIERLQENDTLSEMHGQIRQAALAEEKMASIITWLFEVIGSGDSDEHRMEIEEMRDTFIRAHYGSRQLNVLTTDDLGDDENENGYEEDMMNQSGISQSLNAGLNAYDDSERDGGNSGSGGNGNGGGDVPDWSRMFAQADLDHNGALSPNEFRKLYESNFGRRN